jgi:hypothetical protein
LQKPKKTQEKDNFIFLNARKLTVRIKQRNYRSPHRIAEWKESTESTSVVNPGPVGSASFWRSWICFTVISTKCKAKLYFLCKDIFLISQPVKNLGFDTDLDLDRHQNGKSDPDRHVDPQHRNG